MSSPSQPSRSPLRGDIEGLRSVAVLFVLVYHLGVDRLSGGFAGVDVFFVISGFLITSGLLSEAERSGTVSLVRFYARRARRLLPAATIVLVVTALVGWWVLPGSAWQSLSEDVMAAALYVVNWALALRSVDYLAEDAAASPVQHYWSLSVEEQFYVVIPIMIIGLAWLSRRFGWGVRRTVTVGMGAVVVTSLAVSMAHTASAPETAYFFSTTRAWELGLGSLLACAVPLLRRLTRGTASGLAAAGLLLVAASGVVVSRTTPWPGWAALLPTLGAAAVIAAGVAHSSTAAGRLLALRPLVLLGGLSYSIYLWHWPLIALAGEVTELTAWHKVGLAVASIGLAWLSKHLVEDPIRFGSIFAGRPRPTLAMGAAGMALSLAAAGVVWTQVPRLTDTPTDAPGALALAHRQPSSASSSPDPAQSSSPRSHDGATPTPTRATTALAPEFTRSGPIHPSPAAAPDDIPGYYDDDCQTAEGDATPRLDCVYGDKDGDVTVALTGDSKAGQWFDALEAIADAHGWRLELYLKSACALNPSERAPDCRTYNDRVMRHLTSEQGRVDYVVTSALLGGANAAEGDAAAAGYDSYWDRLERVGTTVVAISDTPRPGGEERRYECVERHPDDYLECAFPANDGGGSQALRRAAGLGASRTWLDLNPWVCPRTPDGKCPAVVGEILVYRQGTHITRTYVESMSPIVEERLVETGILDRPSPRLPTPARR
ncbi:MAG TPA: acyltransferase family protein [Intrasporangium sp.]|uniref:acyltransferase family protein n=1 Tax=Intrasporangium sp. TaxID=1925024 RepID=UPI002B470D7C|nr:acyltransferase family protein [Intrasporangium sp.]HKX69194.1 acyltransferase family protein [Intrasporangium sp.]